MGAFHRPLLVSYSLLLSRRFVAHPLLITFAAALLIGHIAVSYSGWIWHFTHRCHASSQPHPWASVPPPADAPPLVVASIIDDFLPPHIRRASIRNKRQYAALWNYSAVIPSRAALAELQPVGLPVAWKKFTLAQQLLTRFEFVLMVDADAVFMRPDVGWHAATALMQRNNHSLLISDDLNGPNSGIFLLRRSEWTTRFLNDALQSSAYLSKPHKLIPLKYENRAFLYLLNRWPTCFGVRRIDALMAPVHNEYRARRQFVSTVPRCWINRHPKRATSLAEFFDAGAGFDDVEDAFIMHAAGGDVRGKSETLGGLFEMAEARMAERGSVHHVQDDVDEHWLAL
eukprot:TRINITY_DN63170_c0_g1_i1.p1 TRINITY_DN63170_c0_g1~~TRINITY_DN63170_c0_g1_i1.p1  ORF type:complete len:342 (-),score=57.66 TRINITY_DN63170_c0_g1_i1:162-1187(-)